MNKKILVGASSFGINKDALALLKANNYEVILNPYKRKLTEIETIKLLDDVEGLLAGLEPLNQQVLKNAKKLKVISRIGIGLDNVDLEVASKLKIKVYNTPQAPTEAVVEYTLSNILYCLRKLNKFNTKLHQKIWQKEISNSITDANILIIGYGHIGQALHKILIQMGATNIHIYDKYLSNYNKIPINDLIKQANVISVHASGKKEILATKEFGFMKENIIIINTSRGETINEKSLISFLGSNPDAVACLDVFIEEPYQGKLCALPNALLSPHIATYTKKCRLSMEMEATLNLLKGLQYE